MRAPAMGLVIVVAAACGGGKSATKTPSTTPPTDGADPGIVARTLVGWGQQAGAAGKTNLFLEVADHTGAAKSYPVGAAEGPCVPTPGRDDSDIVTSLSCVTDGTGTAFRVVYRNALIVLRRAVDPADLPDDVELSFQEILRVDVPVGTKVGPAL